MFFRLRTTSLVFVIVLSGSLCFAQTYSPPIAGPSDEGERAIGNFAVPDDMEIELFAAEPMLANPVCFYVDHQGRFYVGETFRHHHGVTDMREHTSWLVDDLAARTVEDRLVAMKANLGADFASYAEAHDRIKLIEDRDGDGRADFDSVFADGFRDALAGIGAGLLVDRGDVYYTCIPELWKLRDVNDDGVADTREVMSSGYGVHINFLGHDLHGLRKGPDGRLYFSIGDRGLYTKTKEGGIVNEPDTGAVLRCWPDGSGLEVVHRGLRNPQELAFDNYGNLFTGDNNSDAGDQARWVWIVEGGDSGWRIGWQWITKPNLRGPWNAEKMWHPYHPEQPAFICPPLANIGAGPSGLTYYPGTGLPDRYRGHFFLCDFRGDAGRSLIHAFRLEPKGASFEVVDRHDFAQHMLATDVDFGMEGGIYFTDWVQGWDKPQKGRIYRIYDPHLEDSERIEETKTLLAEGFTHRDEDALVALLNHADQRVRQEAQFALADLGPSIVPRLLEIAGSETDLFPRLHALWGVWQLGLQGTTDLTVLSPFLEDENAEIRAQAAKILGDSPSSAVASDLIAALDDPSPRVRFYAATSLGKLLETSSRVDTVRPLVDLLEENNDEDAYLRFAAVFGLAGQADEKTLAKFSNHSSRAVRMGALLALRRQSSPETARFLDDADVLIVTEAARAIHDLPIPDALPALAALADDATAFAAAPKALQRRVLNANYRLTRKANAVRLADAALTERAPEEIRLEALGHLETWSEDVPLDRVTGEWRPMAGGSLDDARDAVASAAPKLLNDPMNDIRVAGARLAGRYKLTGLDDKLFELVAREDDSARSRVAALQALAELDSELLGEAVQLARSSKAESLRMEALDLTAKLSPKDALPVVKKVVTSGASSVGERQRAYAILGASNEPEGGQLLAESVDRLRAGRIADEIALDVVEAAKRSNFEDVRAALDRYRALLPAGDPLAEFRPALHGGDRNRGRDIFFNKIEVSCQRCHVIRGQGGGEVGPDLTGVGGRVTREHILEAVVTPNAAIAEGFENVTLVLKDGSELSGRVVKEDDKAILLEVVQEEAGVDFWNDDEDQAHSTVDVVADDSGKPNLRTIEKKEVSERYRDLSSMPDDLVEYLTPFELRDLVEFLADSR